jgi:hypothetical protein
MSAFRPGPNGSFWRYPVAQGRDPLPGREMVYRGGLSQGPTRVESGRSRDTLGRSQPFGLAARPLERPELHLTGDDFASHVVEFASPGFAWECAASSQALVASPVYADRLAVNEFISSKIGSPRSFQEKFGGFRVHRFAVNPLALARTLMYYDLTLLECA